MFQAIMQWLLESKAIKTSVASAIGSGAVVIALVDAKMAEVKTISEKDKAYMVEYVDQRHDVAIEKIDTVIETNREIKTRIEKIDDRLFNINRKLKE